MKITDKTVNICKYPLIKKKKKRNKRTWIRHKRLSINLIWTEKKKNKKTRILEKVFQFHLFFLFFSSAQLSLHSLHTQPTPGCAAGSQLQLQRPRSFQWSPFPEPANRRLPPCSRENSSRTSPRAEILPNMEPARGRGGWWRESSGEVILARREQQLAPRGRNSQGLLSFSARRRTREGAEKQPTQAARAPPWSVGQVLGSLLERDSDKSIGCVGKEPENLWTVGSHQQLSTCSAENPQFPRSTCIKKRNIPARKPLQSHLLKDIHLLFGMLTKSVLKVNISPELRLRFFHPNASSSSQTFTCRRSTLGA